MTPERPGEEQHIPDGEPRLWYVLWSTCRNEESLLEKVHDKVPAELYDEVWLPRREEFRVVRGEEKRLETPLFKGYLFIRARAEDLHDIHCRLKKEKEYLGILKCEDDFVSLSEFEEKLIDRLTSHRRKSAGQSVGVIRQGVLHILDGPLVGLEPYIKKIDRHKRKAWLEMEIFGQHRRFPAALEIVEKT
ncbi:MAG: hypothetical protein K6B72_02865 [Lachnospiraceae bacterium]|nr:hypothetical protein [Lachnospiraceae bacterium]